MSLYEEVLSIERDDSGAEPVFAVETRTPRGLERVREARRVVLAMEYYDLPNRIDVPGEDLPHVSHFYVEAHPYYRQRVVIVGGKNSACEAALELHRSGAKVTIVHRGDTLGDSVKCWVRPDIDNRIKAGSIAARFNSRVVESTPTAVTIEDTNGARDEVPAEGVLLLTGYRADPEFMRRAGVKVDEDTLEPSLNPETFETNVPGFFVAGGQVAGKKTGTVFIENGRFHGEVIAKTLAERLTDRS